jgi:exosortase A-associated hydrolase 2
LLKAVFIGGHSGRLFCTLRLPPDKPRYVVMVVPAFGDEMNKSRRMLTVLSQRLNQFGIAVLVPDLFGTGDSEGAFVDANWDSWRADLVAVRDWAIGEQLQVRGLVAVRTGALLAAQFAQSLASGELDTTVLWQPVRSGTSFVKQLLRIRTLASAVNAGTRETVESLISSISSGEPVLVGGYALTAATVQPLMALNLDQLDCARLGALHVIEVIRTEDRCGDFAEQLGSAAVRGFRCMGEPYWSATETVCDTTVVARTADVFLNRVVDLA